MPEKISNADRPADDAEQSVDSPKLPTPIRERLEHTRRSITHHFKINSGAGEDAEEIDGYIIVGLYEDGRPGEVFIKIAKQGSTISGLMNTVGILTSMALQYGIPLEALARKFEHMRFEPSGWTANPDIRQAKSLVDYMFRWLNFEFAAADRPIESPPVASTGGEKN